MTITVTPDVLSTPPRVTVEVSVEAGGAMQTVAVYRTAAGVRELIRSQPATGFDQRLVSDYEAPYEVPVTYDWETQYVSPNALTSVFAENWASAGAWTVTNGLDGTWGVAGGKLVRSNGPDRDSRVLYPATPGRYRVSFTAAPVGVPLIDFGGFQINTEARLLIAGAATVAYSSGAGGWRVDVTETGVSLTTDAGTFVVVAPGVQVTKIDLLGTVTTLTAAGTFLYNAPGGNYSGHGAVFTSNRIFVLAMNTAGAVESGSYVEGGVLVFDSAGTYLTTIAFPNGTGNGQAKMPHGICVDGSGRLVIGELVGGRIQRFTIGGSGASTTLTYYDKWNSFVAGPGQQGPWDVACDGTNIYVVAINGSLVKKYNAAGTFVTEWGSYGPADGQFYSPTTVTASPTHVYVADGGYPPGNVGPRVQRFTVAGAFVEKIGGVYGTDIGQWQNGYPPSDMEIVAGVLYISDTSGRVHAYSASLEFSTALPSTTVQSSVPLAASSTTLYVFGRSVYLTAEKHTIGVAAVDDITIQSYGGLVTLKETAAAPITLTPSAAWFIHPAQPALSFRIGKDDWDLPGLVSLGSVENASTATVHRILGSKLPVTTNSSPRASDEVSLVVATTSRETELGLMALLDDQTPILIRIPPSWGVDFADGFYFVGDTSRSRLEQLPDFPFRHVTLPLLSVDSPEVTVDVLSSWTYAAVAVAFATYNGVGGLRATYGSYADLIADRRL